MESIFYQIGSAEIAVLNVDCKGDATGEITINSVSGGLAPYMYQLNENTPTDQSTFTDLNAGTHMIFITDNAGNSYQLDVQVSEPEIELTISNVVFENTITLFGEGGNEPYQYSIDGINFSDDNIFIDLPDGEYMCYIRDANNCEVSKSSIIVNTATKDPILDQLTLFPNPTRDNITVGSESNFNFEYQITDITGKVVQRNDGLANVPFSIEKLPAGIFLIKVHYKTSVKVFKLSKI
jgi:hypothetical protein